MSRVRSSSPSQARSARAALWLLVVVVAAATVGVMLLLQNIRQRKAEGTQVAFPLTTLTEETIDPAEWGKNFPRQYDAYLRTVDNERTRFGGSEAMPLGDGKFSKAVQKLETDPLLKTIFAGYAFSIDYRERRGHAFMLSDQRETERVTKKSQPGACLQCHATNVVAYRKAGLEHGAAGSLSDSFASANGQDQLFKGFEAVCGMKYDEATKLVDHPIACIDCHDPGSMRLRVTRPGFLTGIRALAASNEPVPHLPSIERWRKGTREHAYDPNADAMRQEMRSMVCAQCHVEYYFKGEHKLVTYPWSNGLKVEEIEKYYDDAGWTDFTHGVSGAPALKAQHPEFELWSQGVHARAGVACADCHMPYVREGAVKISDHQVRSPLLSISRACQTCHATSEEEITSRVSAIQNRHAEMLARSEVAVVDLIDAIKAAKEAGATDEQLKTARGLQRKAQWRCDFVNAENSMGFHAPQESMRILGEAIDFARQGQVNVAKLSTPAK